MVAPLCPGTLKSKAEALDYQPRILQTIAMYEAVILLNPPYTTSAHYHYH